MDMSTDVEAEPVREVIGQDDKGRDLVMYAGKVCRVLTNGALQNAETGKMMRPPYTTQAHIIRSTEQAQAMSFQRWHGSRQAAAVEVVRRATNDNSIQDIDAADAYMLGAMVEEIVLNSEVRADHRIKAYEIVLQQAGMDGRAPKQASTGDGSGDVTLTIPRDTLMDIVAALRAEQERRSGE